MQYTEIKPGDRLKPYVKCYYIYEGETDAAFDDTVFPSGNMEIIFNLGTGNWQTAVENGFVTTPAVELWGQIIRPLCIRSIGKNTMLGIRCHPHAAGCFLNGKVDVFNNQVVDFSDVEGKAVNTLYSKLLETAEWDKRIELVEDFLLGRLLLVEKKFGRMAVVGDIMKELRHENFFDNIES